MKKLQWVVALSIIGIFASFIFSVSWLALLPTIILVVSLTFLVGCRGGRTPKSSIATALLMITILFLIFLMTFGLAKLAVQISRLEKNDTLIEEVKEEEKVNRIYITTTTTSVEPNDEVKMEIEAEGVKVEYLTICDLSSVGGNFEIINNEKSEKGSQLTLRLVEVEENTDTIGFLINKEGISSNEIQFSVEKQEEEGTVEEPKRKVVTVIKEVIKEVPVEKVKEVVKEVPVEVVKEVPVEVIKEVKKTPEPAATQQPKPNNYVPYYGDPTSQSGYSGDYGDPTDNRDNNNNNNRDNVRITGSTNVTAGRTYTYTISGISNFSLSKLEYPDFVTAKKKSNNSFTLTFDDDYTGNVYLDYNDLELDFKIRVQD